jgi:hypothetical protein
MQVYTARVAEMLLSQRSGATARVELMTERREYEVYDRERKLIFTGELLAQSSSFRPGKKRWIELRLVKTDAGSYVISGEGPSLYDGEITRYWAHNCARAEGVVEQLHLLDENDTRYMTRTSRDLLQEAAEVDPAIAAAFAAERIA